MKMKYSRIIIIPESFGKRVVIDFQLCDLNQVLKKDNKNKRTIIK